MTLFGQRFPIRLSMYDTLQGIRDEASTRAIWVAATCINQADATERGLLAAVMGDMQMRMQCHKLARSVYAELNLWAWLASNAVWRKRSRFRPALEPSWSLYNSERTL